MVFEAAVERLLLDLEERDRDAGIGEVHRDAAAHRARADDAGGLDRALRRVGRHVLHLGGLALGEEVVALRRRLGGRQQLHEQLALALHAFVERQLDGSLHALDDVPRRLEATRPAGDRLFRFGEQVGRFERRRQVAHPPARRVLRHQHLGMSHGAGQQVVAFDNGVDDALALGLGRRDVPA